MRTTGIALSLVVMCACVDVADVESTAQPLSGEERNLIASRVRAQFASRGIVPIPPKPAFARKRELVKLGQALMFDKILSDNRDVSCMTCHPAAVGGDDDRHLSVGVGGGGLGPRRTGGIDIPRNAPPLFNLHAMDSLFWDGRVERLPDGSYRTPAGAQLTPEMTAVFQFGALSAIAMFPITNRHEMRGLIDGIGGDDLAAIPDDDFTGMWEATMDRLRAIPRYRELFGDAYPEWPGPRGERIDTMTFAHASNAMAAFMVEHFTSTDSPWDRFVAGDNKAFEKMHELLKDGPVIFDERDTLLGAERFLQTCANCHNGPLLSDDRYHNTALAQLGPGVGDGDGLDDDFGRERVPAGADARCGNEGMGASCRYAFRTTPLRNVLLTAPYGHAGQIGRFGNRAAFEDDLADDIEDLRAFVAHYAVDPRATLMAYDATQLEDRLELTVLDNRADIIAHVDPLFANGSPITPDDVHILTAFMAAQTSKVLLEAGRHSDDANNFLLCNVVPKDVPSRLPIDGAGLACH